MITIYWYSMAFKDRLHQIQKAFKALCWFQGLSRSPKNWHFSSEVYQGSAATLFTTKPLKQTRLRRSSDLASRTWRRPLAAAPQRRRQVDDQHLLTARGLRQSCCCCRSMGQTDRRMASRLLNRPCIITRCPPNSSEALVGQGRKNYFHVSVPLLAPNAGDATDTGQGSAGPVPQAKGFGGAL